jgi:hypothetical protein
MFVASPLRPGTSSGAIRVTVGKREIRYILQNALLRFDFCLRVGDGTVETSVILSVSGGVPWGIVYFVFSTVG